jgi:hypothetical protein
MRAASIVLALLLCLAYLSGDGLADTKVHSTLRSKKDNVDDAIADKIRGRVAQPTKTKTAPADTSSGAVGTK